MRSAAFFLATKNSNSFASEVFPVLLRPTHSVTLSVKESSVLRSSRKLRMAALVSRGGTGTTGPCGSAEPSRGPGTAHGDETL